jgi:AcrR family transcriptional regulator
MCSYYAILHVMHYCAARMFAYVANLCKAIADGQRRGAMTSRKGGEAITDEPRISSEPQPAGLRELNNRRRRNSIVGCARQQFLRKGFENTTIAEIARAARTAPRTVYNFFPTKIDLLGEIVREDIETRMIAELAAKRPMPTDPYEGMMQLIEMQGRALGAWSWKLLKLFSSHAVAGGLNTIAGRMHASSDEFLTAEIHDRLVAYQKRGSLPAEMDVAALARAVFSIVNGCYFSWLGGDDEDIAPLVAAVREQIAFVLPTLPLGIKHRARTRR